MGKVIAVCRSEQKGTKKINIGQGEFRVAHGLVGDAHAGNWHRQVSLLALERIEEFQSRGAAVEFGDFGENLVVQGLDFKTLPIGTRLRCGNVVLEITQIGKKCHQGCAIFQQMGDCIMPREGVFAIVLAAGVISVGDTMEIIAPDSAAIYTAAVVTASDSGFAGRREDLSGPLAAELLTAQGYKVVEQTMLPDDRKLLSDKLRELTERDVSLVLTTGGTGFALRDCTPEATLDVVERLTPGIPEAMRSYSMQLTKRAMLSRAVAGIRRQTLIVNLPGSPRAVRECLEYILPELEHGIKILRGADGECARREGDK